MSTEERPLLGPTRLPHEEESNYVEPCDNVFEEHEQNEAEEQSTPTPLPMRQISMLLLMQLSEPIAYTVINPFVAELVNKTGITGGDSGKVGYYAGLIESTFYLTQSLFTLQYGRLSDQIGRRPVLIFGLFGLSISIFSFGLSTKFWHLVVARALSGALNGNTGVAKSMMVELTDESNQAQCFALIPIVWSAGATFGPFLGGTLSHPANLLPGIFDTPFWNKYPYFLPCLIAAIYACSVATISALFLRETLPTRTKLKRDSQTEYGTASLRPPTPQPAPPIRSILTRRVRIAIANYAFLAFNDISYLGLIPVIFAVPVDKGGLGLSSRSIGLVLGLQGILTGSFQVLFFAPLHKRFGSKRIFVTGYSVYIILILSFPVMNALARQGNRGAMWVVLILHLLISCSAFMAFSCMAIFVNNSAPSKNSLGTLNGISQTTISVIRAIGPWTATSLFALSVDKKLLGGGLVYVVLVTVNCVGLFVSRWLKEGKRAYE